MLPRLQMHRKSEFFFQVKQVWYTNSVKKTKWSLILCLQTKLDMLVTSYIKTSENTPPCWNWVISFLISPRIFISFQQCCFPLLTPFPLFYKNVSKVFNFVWFRVCFIGFFLYWLTGGAETRLLANLFLPENVQF